MILDSSAIVGIVLREPGFADLLAKMESAESLGIGTPTLVETGIVLTAKLGENGRAVLSRMVDEFQVTPVPFGVAHWQEAMTASQRFGRGRHAASLNFGDCLSYATSRLTRQPLLFTGQDFARTDVDAA